MAKILVVVDMQNDFCRDMDSKIVDGIVEKMESSEYDIITLTRDEHVPEEFYATQEGKKWPIHCIPNTEGAQLIHRVAYAARSIPDNRVFHKNSFGYVAWHNFAASHPDISEIHLVGTVLEICVLANAVALRSAFPKAKVVILSKLCDSMYETPKTSTIKLNTRFGKNPETHDVLWMDNNGDGNFCNLGLKQILANLNIDYE